MNTQQCRRYSGLLWIVLLVVGVHIDSHAESTKADAVKERTIATIAKECKRCHQDDQSLNELPAAELTAMVTAMIAKEMDHPTELPALSEQQVDELVRALKPE